MFASCLTHRCTKQTNAGACSSRGLNREKTVGVLFRSPLVACEPNRRQVLLSQASQVSRTTNASFSIMSAFAPQLRNGQHSSRAIQEASHVARSGGVLNHSRAKCGSRGYAQGRCSLWSPAEKPRCRRGSSWRPEDGDSWSTESSSHQCP